MFTKAPTALSHHAHLQMTAERHFLHNLLLCTSCTTILHIYIVEISSYAWGLRHSLLDLCSGTASITLRPQLGDFVARFSRTGIASITLRP